MELQKLSVGQIQKNFSNVSKETEKQDAKQEKLQLKEHCSSKTANALRGVVMGLALAAGVAGGAKAMPVQAAENQPVNNTTSVSEEQEANVQKTDVEMAVDELLDESEVQITTLHVGDENTCHGKMTLSPFLGGRDYNMAKITEEGCLVFYESVEIEIDDDYSHTFYFEVNNFDLKAETDGDSIQLQSGSRFEENVNLNGDYVELAEDGRTFYVYDKDGEQIGYVRADTPDSYSTKLFISTIAAVGFAAGYVAVKYEELA